MKLKSKLLREVDGILDYGVYALFSEIIEYLMLQSINSTMQAMYLESACNRSCSWIIWKIS